MKIKKFSLFLVIHIFVQKIIVRIKNVHHTFYIHRNCDIIELFCSACARKKVRSNVALVLKTNFFNYHASTTTQNSSEEGNEENDPPQDNAQDHKENNAKDDTKDNAQSGKENNTPQARAPISFLPLKSKDPPFRRVF